MHVHLHLHMHVLMQGFVCLVCLFVCLLYPPRLREQFEAGFGAVSERILRLESLLMSDKIKVPLRFQVEVEERFSQPADKRWHAQFKFYPLGYFRGQGACPAAALSAAWRKFRREVDPGKRWWIVAMGEVPAVRY